MGLFNAVFGRKQNISTVITTTQNNLFRIYGIKSPSDELKIKASVYLCIAGIAMINEIGASSRGPVLNKIIDKIVNDTRELTKPLSVNVLGLAEF